MATRSTIALEYADGTVKQIYCHWDGYLEHNGVMLMRYYSDPFVLAELIDHGNTSSLLESVAKIDIKGCFYGEPASMFIDFDDYRKNANFEEFNYILRPNGQWYVESRRFTGLLSEAFEAEAEEDAA
jgi:hypothetical protein